MGLQGRCADTCRTTPTFTSQGDTYLYELRRHLPLRDVDPGSGSGALHGQGLFEIPQPVAAPLHVEDVSAVQQSVGKRAANTSCPALDQV